LRKERKCVDERNVQCEFIGGRKREGEEGGREP